MRCLSISLLLATILMAGPLRSPLAGLCRDAGGGWSLVCCEESGVCPMGDLDLNDRIAPASSCLPDVSFCECESRQPELAPALPVQPFQSGSGLTSTAINPAIAAFSAVAEPAGRSVVGHNTHREIYLKNHAFRI